MATPWTSLAEKLDRTDQATLLHDLGQVFARLWTFHQAMARGIAVPNCEECLAEMGEALRRVSRRGRVDA